MVDKELLDAINQSIMASENRMTANFTDAINQSIMASENRITAYFTETYQKSLDTIAEGYAGLSEKLKRLDDFGNDLDEIKGSMAVLEAAIIKNSASIIEIKKAQG